MKSTLRLIPFSTALQPSSRIFRPIVATYKGFPLRLQSYPRPSLQCRFVTTEPHEASRTASTGTKSQARPKEIRLTTESYPNIKRNPSFAQIVQTDIDYFRSVLGEKGILEGNSSITLDDIAPFNTDWMRKYRGQSRLVLKPKTTEQISKILLHCNNRKIAVVPQGGNTGLVGGSVPVFDEVVVSTANMNQIRSFDPISGILVADAGVILQVADNYLRENDHIFPLDLGAKGSCHIGGNIATNAGGLRLLRYGSLHGTVLGIEAVLPNGQILNDLSKLRKNNTGYDLKQLFIGSEGTIGIITAISVQCPRKPASTNVAYFGCLTFANVLIAFAKAKQKLGEILSAFEFMDGTSQQLLHKVSNKPFPLESPSGYPFNFLVETSGSNADHDNEKLESFLETLLEEGIVSDGVVAQDETQYKTIWSWREGITEILGHWGGTYKYDFSIPVREFFTLVQDTKSHLKEAGLYDPANPDAPVVEVVGFGHMGDGNLHLNIPVRGYNKKVEMALEPWVYEWIQKREGSISAEHGLGLAKSTYVGYSRNDSVLALMRQIKKLYDPNGIMNPYKYVIEN